MVRFLWSRPFGSSAVRRAIARSTGPKLPWCTATEACCRFRRRPSSGPTRRDRTINRGAPETKTRSDRGFTRFLGGVPAGEAGRAVLPALQALPALPQACMRGLLERRARVAGPDGCGHVVYIRDRPPRTVQGGQRYTVRGRAYPSR